MLVFAQVCKVDLHEWKAVVRVVNGRRAIDTLRYHCGIILKCFKFCNNLFDGHDIYPFCTISVLDPSSMRLLCRKS
jgi:hypothetical protein